MNILRPIPVNNAVLTSSTVAEADYPAWSATTIYEVGDTVTRISPSATVTVTIASPAVVSWASHDLAAGTPVVLTTTGALPTGLTAGAVYYVRRVLTSGTVTLSPEENGAEVNTSGSQSGTHTGTASVHKSYEAKLGDKSTVNITIASPAVVTWTAHGLSAGTPVVLTTTGALPTGLTAGTTYYVVATIGADVFSLAATPGGAAINTTGSQSGTHTGGLASNYGKYPQSNPSVWLDIGATNRWRMFDRSVGTQTSNPDSIEVVAAIPGLIDHVALFNLSAGSVTVEMTDVSEGVVYDQTFSLSDDSGIIDFWDYFFDPIERIADLIVSDLPMYADATVTVTLDDLGQTVLCGVCYFGLGREVGSTLHGARVGIQDYSIKSSDEYGNTAVTERAFSKRATYDVWVDNLFIDKLQNILAGYRAVPVVYKATSEYASTWQYGFYKDFGVTIAYEDVSVCAIEIEGLT